MAHGNEFWVDKLSDFVDGHLDPDERQAVAEHLLASAESRAIEAELLEVKRRARALGGIAPPPDLFDRIRARMDDQTDVVDLTLHIDPAPAAASTSSPARRRWSGEIRAAAMIAALVATGAAGWALGAGQGGVGVSGSSGEAVATTPSDGPLQAQQAGAEIGAAAAADLAASVADLERLLDSAPEALDANTVRILRKNLALIQAAVAESRDALRQDPDNAYVRRHLEGAMERQRAFVQEAAQLFESDD